MVKQITGIFPDGFVKLVSMNLFVIADTFAAKPKSIVSRTSVVGITTVALSRFAARVGIATALTFQQSLKQMSCAVFPFARLQSVVIQMLLDGREQLLRNDRGDGNHDLLIPLCIVDGTVPT